MRGIILAAGLGTRLRPLTDNVPKTMVEVGNKPILAYQLEALKAAHISDIIICTGYKAEEVEKYCKSYYRDVNITFVHNVDYATTNNMYSLYLAREYIEGDIVLMNGDVVIDTDIITKMNTIIGSCIATDIGRYISESMKVTIDEFGHIVDIAKTITKDRAYGSSIDVYKFVSEDTVILRDALCKHFEENRDKNQWTEVLLQELFQAGKLSPMPYPINHSRWLEVDDHDDLAMASGIFHRVENEFESKKIAFLDGDGTLFVGGQLVSGADKFVQHLQDQGMIVYILSNNTSKTPEDYVKKLRGLGLTIGQDNILLPSTILIEDLKSQGINNIYLIANKSVTQQFISSGFSVEAQNPQAVVLTYDTELTYKKLFEASRHLHNGVRYFATHIDLVCPTEFGPVPDIGSMIAMLETATGRVPECTYGKPSPILLTKTLEQQGFTNNEAVVIGDRIYTDIRMGKEAGIFSILVLSGETTDDDIKIAVHKPDVVVKSVAQLLCLFC